MRRNEQRNTQTRQRGMLTMQKKLHKKQRHPLKNVLTTLTTTNPPTGTSFINFMQHVSTGSIGNVDA